MPGGGKSTTNSGTNSGVRHRQHHFFFNFSSNILIKHRVLTTAPTLMVGIATQIQVDPATTTLGLAMGSTTGKKIFKYRGI